MPKRRISTAEHYKHIGERCFKKTYESMQCLNFTVLYYNFDYSTKEKLRMVTEELFRTDERMQGEEIGGRRFSNYDDMRDEVGKKFNHDIIKITREIPFRAVSKMMGGIDPRWRYTESEIAVNKAYSAVEQAIVLVGYTMIKLANWGKTEFECWWAHIKENSACYANGMTDKFVSDYFLQEVGSGIHGVE